MQIIDDYRMNEKTVLLTGEYGENAEFYTRVIEGHRLFLVKKSPEEIIHKSLLHFGNSYKGAVAGSKEVMGKMNMCPIQVNEKLGIYIFPSKSPNHLDCVWFSLVHIKKTKALRYNQTLVDLNFGHSITLKTKVSSFNHKIERTSQLRRVIAERTNHPITFFVEPRKGYQLYKNIKKNNYETN